MFHIEPNSPQHLKVGKIGEDIACKYLKDRGYKIIERNFRKTWGEIDIICLKKCSENSPWNNITNTLINVLRKTNNKIDIYHDSDNLVPQRTNSKKLIFVEVKTLKNSSGMNPEENLTEGKKHKLIRTCELYVSNNPRYINTDWQIDAILIEINNDLKKAKVRHIESAIY